MKHIFLFGLALIFMGACDRSAPVKPNVIIVMTDDQGIGDLGCHGNPWLKTPNLDDFYAESVRLTDFHVSPLCTPTRSAIITGRYPINNGAWATFKGRDAITTESFPTMPEVFRQNGYTTAIFGKWHLGDNYPVRPTDCGFDVAIHHSAGGVGELSDYWGNSYFDDVYLENNEPRPFEGYCTDVWFSEAMKFMEKQGDEPFFVYLPTNAPHSPLIVEDRYAEPYRELAGKAFLSAEFYGMIANIDENFGRLVAFLEESGLAENTILVFMTDNGSQYGNSADYLMGYNKGYRGRKGDREEGGHRVPFFIRWPAAGIEGGTDIDKLTAHVDLLPTLASLCEIDIPEGKAYDGVDFSKLFFEEKSTLGNRTVFIHHRQDWREPKDVAQTCLMMGKWRLINGVELYDIEADPGQLENLYETHPQVVQQILEDNQAFVDAAKGLEAYKEFPVSVVGSPEQKLVKLTIQHAIGDDKPIWMPEHVAEGVKIKNAGHALEFAEAGKYRISCCRWPKECPGPLQGIPENNPKDLYSYKSLAPDMVRINVFGQVYEKAVEPEASEVVFELDLPSGKSLLESWFLEGDQSYGVYYTYIEKI